MFWHDNKKTRCFETIFQNFLARAPPFKKRSFFTQFLPPLIRTQAGVKSGQLAQLHLNSTFCLSQSLPQSCNTKNWGRLSGPQNAVNYGVSWTYHAFYCKKSAPPPAKADCVSASGMTCLLHLRCGRICFLVAAFFFGWRNGLKMDFSGNMVRREKVCDRFVTPPRKVVLPWDFLIIIESYSPLSSFAIIFSKIVFPPFFIIFSPFFVDFLIICLQCHVSPGNKALWENDG